MSVARKAVRNTFYLFLNWLSATLLSFIYWVIIGKLLLPSDFGKIATANQLLLLISNFSMLGFGIAIGKLVPEYIARGEKKKIPGLVKGTLKITLPTSIVFCCLLLLFSPLLSSTGLTFRDILTICIGIVATQFSGVFNRIWYGMQNMKKIFINGTINQIFKLSLSAFLIFLGFGYYGPIFALSLMFVLSSFLYFSPNFVKNGEKVHIHEVFQKFALPAFLATVCWLVFNNTRYLILSLLSSETQTGYFSLAFNLASLIISLGIIVSSSVFPIVSELETKGEKEKESRLLLFAIRYCLLFSLPFAVFLFVFGDAVINIFFRKEYLPASSLFVFLLPASVIFAISRIILGNIYAMGKTKLYTILSFFIMLFSLGTGIALTMLYEAKGMAISFLLSSIFSFLCSLVVFIKRFSFKTAYLSDVIKMLFSSFLLFVLWKLVDYLSLNFFTKLFFALVGFPLYFLFLKISRFFKKEDYKIFEIFVKKLNYPKNF